MLAESVTPIRRCPPYIPAIFVTNRLTHLGVPVQWLRVMTKPVAFRRKLAKVVPPLIFGWTQSIDSNILYKIQGFLHSQDLLWPSMVESQLRDLSVLQVKCR